MIDQGNKAWFGIIVGLEWEKGLHRALDIFVNEL